MPFISIASNPALLDTGIYKKAVDITGIAQKEKFIIYFGIAIIIFYVFRAIYSIAHTYLINRFSTAINKYFSGTLFERIMSLPYRIYIERNSGNLTGIINSESRQLGVLSLTVLQLSTELFVILSVYALMLAVNWRMTLVLTLILAILGLAFLQILVTKNRELGIKRTAFNLKSYRTLLEAFGNYKFIRLKGNKKELLRNYSNSLDITLKTQAASNTLNVIPKSILESLGFSLLIAVVIFILVKYNDAAIVIPTISMYALALYRILPSLHRLILNINSIAFMQRSLELVEEAINLPVDSEGDMPVNFSNSVTLNNISFKYATGNEIIHNICLSIKRGETIAITGESGGGKTTLVDLIIGIHKPLSGSLYVDDIPLTDENVKSWRKKIGYIPQSIYLFDGTVAENVVLGAAYDEAKIIQVLQMANIWDFLQTKQGIQTRVGEGGIQLSGGQQQRVGIARALYSDPEILVLDEATSSLDTETESKIMDEIYQISESKTLIVIAHRISTVERCQRKIRIEDGKIA
jgi:ATP-binding cassette subfamily B protein/ATP-binding cassette subfamily C protein